MHFLRVFISPALVLVLLTGCRAEPEPTVTVEPTAIPATVAPTASTTSTGIRSTAGGVGESVAMVASDPARVDLAAGQLQLVEFFAFW